MKWNPKDVWAAGRAALQAKEDAAAKVAPAPQVVKAPVSDAFDPRTFTFEDRVYRVTFKNGNSGQYRGLHLGRRFPFNPRLIARVEPLEEVGQGI